MRGYCVNCSNWISEDGKNGVCKYKGSRPHRPRVPHDGSCNWWIEINNPRTKDLGVSLRK